MKLNNLPPVYYVSLEESYDRQIVMEKQLRSLGVFDYTRITAYDGRKTDYVNDPNVTGKLVKSCLDSGQVATVLSHLKAIKHWLETCETETAIFLEDDMNLTTCQFWNFTWDDVIKGINEHQWNCVQFSIIKGDDCEVALDEADIHFRRRSWYNWSAGSYMMKREYARKILDYYIPEEGKLKMDLIDGINVIPYIENVLYVGARPYEYTLPLFVENVDFPSTFYPYFMGAGMEDSGRKKGQIDSSNFVYNWWKENGSTVNILELMKLKNTRYWEQYDV